MHLALRAGGPPVRLFAGDADLAGFTLGHAVVGGARAAPYLKAALPGPSAGAVLEPGAARALLGATAAELAGRHTALDDLWGARAVAVARERLAEAPDAAARLDTLERALLARLRGAVRLLHPAVAEALLGLRTSPSVAAAVARTGYSHRRVIALFREEVGLAPKAYARVLRFQRAVALLAGRPAAPLGELALRAGYADQAHLGREFLALAGLSPGRYRRADPAFPNHLPVPAPGGVNYVQERARAAR
jgi:AraC-like DNA-binding protein